MKFCKRLVASLTTSTALLALAASPATAQSWPTKPVRILVGFAPGGAPDLIARILAQRLSEGLGQPVVVENRAGASGNIAAETVAHSVPDGHTLLMATVSLAIAPSLYQKLGFDVSRDFQPVGMVASVPLILVTHPSVPANSVKELIALAKSQPGKLNYASVGYGSPQHLSGEMLKLMSGAEIVHVPYKGGAPATQAVLAGEVQLFFAGMPPALPHLKAGKLKALAVTSKRRSSAAPDVPTMDEAGVPGFVADNWHAIIGPRGMPADAVARFNAELGRTLALPAVRQQLAAQGADPWVATPDETARLMREEIGRWAQVVKASGAKVE